MQNFSTIGQLTSKTKQMPHILCNVLCERSQERSLPGRGGHPYLHGMIPTARGNIPAVARPGQRIHGIAMPSVRIECNSSLCVPNLHGMIPTSRGNIPAIGRPGQRTDFIGVSLVGEEKLARKGFPDSYRFISTPGSDEASVRGPGQCLNDTPRIFFGEVVKCFSCQCAPDQYRVVPISRGNVLTVGRPGHCVHKFSVSSVNADSLARVSIPDLHCVVPTARSNILTIRRPA